MKYQNLKTVDAEYDAGVIQKPNPFFEALPGMMSKEDLFDRIKGRPVLPADIDGLSGVERRQLIPALSSLFIPMDYMYRLYDTIYRAIEITYMTMTVMETTRQLNALFSSNTGEIPQQDYTTHSDCGAILGVPGVGKTSTIKRCMGAMPQVIAHSLYRGKSFYCKQITYLFVECPSDCSVKTLGFNIANAIDMAIGSNYFAQMTKTKSLSVSAMALYIKQFCLNHHVGCIIIDEIQNVVLTAQAQKQTNRLIKFLVELMNDTCTSIFLVGTLDAEELFLKEEHLKRRTRGARLLPMTSGATYRHFLDTIWSYQFTRKRVPLTDKMANLIFDYSGGIPAYITKIFQESQIQAIISGHEEIDVNTVLKVIEMLSIHIPKTYTLGTSISNYSVVEEPNTQLGNVPGEPQTSSRGRKAAKRDERDLLSLALDVKMPGDLLEKLRQLSLLDEVQTC